MANSSFDILDISPYAWKLLVNHKIQKNDVSGGYVIQYLERLRRTSQKICDFVLRKVEFSEQGKCNFNKLLRD